ncbi:hypothetical protein EJB05_11848, partial [Eragrostis curvula]
MLTATHGSSITDILATHNRTTTEDIHEKGIKCFDALIVPSGDEEEETTFRVMGVAQCFEKLVVFIFSSCSGSWSAAASTTWEAVSLTVPQHGRVLGYTWSKLLHIWLLLQESVQ